MDDLGPRVHLRIRPGHAVAGITAVSMALTLLELPASVWLTLGAASLACGVAAQALMAASAVLGSRWSRLENAFGGLDRVYQVHKWLGIFALVFATIHLVFRAHVSSTPTASIVIWPSSVEDALRGASFAGLMLTALLALNRNIPYGVWRLWHKLSGPFYVVVVLHWISIKSPIALESPAGLWLAGVSIAAVAAAFYKLALYPLLSNRAEYRVVEVAQGASAVQIDLAPVGAGLAFQPGQFSFLRMKVEGLREPHPFTIASANSVNGQISFVIRALGDFTSRLKADVKVGMLAEVNAPFGRFKRLAQARREIWIAGGVGAAPFMAWLKADPDASLSEATLFYFATPGRAFPPVETLQALAVARGVEFWAVAGAAGSHDFDARFAELIHSADPATLDVAVCGPAALRDRVRRLVKEGNLPESCVRYELFEFR